MRVLGALTAVFLLIGGGQANAGTVTFSGGVVTYTASDANASEDVEVGDGFLKSGRPFGPSDCPVDAEDETRVNCAGATRFVVNLLGASDEVDGSAVTGAATLEAHGGEGGDTLVGTRNNDVLDAGAGENYLYDLAGNDTVIGGPNNDTWHAGTGTDTFSGGAGDDTAFYDERTASVTVTLDGVPDDGVAGEGDNVGADVETVYGGSGADTLVAGANPDGARIIGGAGNDGITGGPQEDRLEGGDGDDVIDSRDGRFDSVDCGAGNDVVLADLDDTAENCEQAPDRDGDGFANEADCAPDDPLVNPGAAEIYGNPVDEDCKEGAQYFTVALGLTYSGKGADRGRRLRFTQFAFTGLQAGDRIVLRCRGKGCPFRTKTRTVAAARNRLSLLKLFKKRALRAGTVVEAGQFRPNQHARVDRLRIRKGPKIKRTKLCVLVGSSEPGPCPAPPA